MSKKITQAHKDSVALWAKAGYCQTSIAVALDLDRKTVMRIGWERGLEFGPKRIKPFWVKTLEREVPDLPPNLEGRYELFKRLVVPGMAMDTLLLAMGEQGDSERITDWWLRWFKAQVVRRKLRVLDYELRTTND